jgi:hypothetical protein
MPHTAQDCIKDVITIIHQQHLKPLGFRKSGSTWVRGENWRQVINIQLSKWNSSDEAQLTLNFGISVEALHKAAERPSFKGPPKEYNCVIRCRIGQLHDDRKDKWWTIQPSSDAKNVANDLSIEIHECGLPWLIKLDNYTAIANELIAQKNPFMAALALSLSGNTSKAETLMAEAVHSSNRHALPHLLRIASANSIPAPANHSLE